MAAKIKKGKFSSNELSPVKNLKIKEVLFY